MSLTLERSSYDPSYQFRPEDIQAIDCPFERDARKIDFADEVAETVHTSAFYYGFQCLVQGIQSNIHTKIPHTNGTYVRTVRPHAYPIRELQLWYGDDIPGMRIYFCFPGSMGGFIGINNTNAILEDPTIPIELTAQVKKTPGRTFNTNLAIDITNQQQTFFPSSLYAARKAIQLCRLTLDQDASFDQFFAQQVKIDFIKQIKSCIIVQ